MSPKGSCTKPHPKRADGGIDVQPDLEIMGSYSDDCWARCRLCGAWVWLTTDLGSKWQYIDGWDLARDLSERAFVSCDVAAVAELLVSNDLPRGPAWRTSGALLGMLRATTPTATDAQRSAALDASPLTGRWVEAASLLREVATHGPVTASDMVFAVDARLPGRSFSEFHEIGSSLVLFQESPSPEVLRFDAKGVSEFQCATPIRFLARNEQSILFTVTTAEGELLHLIDASGQVGSFAPSPTRYTVTSLDDGGWLFVPDDDALVRFVEFHEANGLPRVKMRMAFGKGNRFACAPRRMGDGWIASGCVDDDGEEQALTLFDVSWRTLAQSTGARGQRLIERIDDGAVWCETIAPPFTLERWERRGRVLERTFAVATQSWFRAAAGIVVSLRAGPLAGYDDSGAELFRHERAVHGATYFSAVRDGVLVHDDRGTRVIDPRSGRDTSSAYDVECASVRVTPGGVAYVKESTALRVIDTMPKRIYVGEHMQLETLCGEDVLLRDDGGHCLLVSPDGSIRGFDAPRARFSVVATRGGPYVVEPEHLRIGRLP